MDTPQDQANRIPILTLAAVVITALWASVAFSQQVRILPPPGAPQEVVPIAYYWAAEEAAEENADEQLGEGSGDDSSEKSIEQRLAELEANYGDLQDAHDDLQDDYKSLSDSLKGYALSGHSAATMKVNGRVHLDMWNFPDSSPGINLIESNDPNISPQDRLGFRRMRFGVKGGLPYNMRYRIEMEFAGGNDVEFRDAYLGWTELPIFHDLLIGNQKRPYGLDHLNSSRYNVFIERPFVIESFNQDARRFGIQSHGVSDDLAWNWRYGVFNQRLIQDEGNYISDHFQAQIAGRLANTIWYDHCSDGRGYAHWAVSGTWADTDQFMDDDNFAGSGISEARFRHRPEARTVRRWLDTGSLDSGDAPLLATTDYSLLGFESVVNVGPFQVVGEYQNVWCDRRGESQVFLHGAYAYVSYFLTGEHIPWDRETGCLGRVKPFENFFLVNRCQGGAGWGLGAWQVALRYSYADFNDRDVFGGVGESITAGINWHWTPYARMQFNYIYGTIDNRDENNDEGPAGGVPLPTNLVSGDYQIIGTRLMVDF